MKKDSGLQGSNYPENDPAIPLEKRVFVLKPGFVFNPFNKWPRNLTCFCGSGRKFKKCCVDQVFHAIPDKIEKATKKDFEKLLSQITALHNKGITFTIDKVK